jgi:hypothetical protein
MRYWLSMSAMLPMRNITILNPLKGVDFISVHLEIAVHFGHPFRIQLLDGNLKHLISTTGLGNILRDGNREAMRIKDVSLQSFASLFRRGQGPFTSLIDSTENVLPGTKAGAFLVHVGGNHIFLVLPTRSTLAATGSHGKY